MAILAVGGLAVGGMDVVMARPRQTASSSAGRSLRGDGRMAAARTAPAPSAGQTATRAGRSGPAGTATSPASAPDPAALAAADAFVMAYAGYDWHDPAGRPGSWRGLVTPDLYARLTAPSGSAPGMTPAQVADHQTALPRVTATVWEGAVGDGAVRDGTGAAGAAVLVDCVLTVTGDHQAAQQVPTPYPLTLVSSAGRWLVSSVGADTGG